jgi:hypothetical protein
VYQAFPNPMPFPGPAPTPVRVAVRLMYAGAVVYAISGIVGVISLVNTAPQVADGAWPDGTPAPPGSAHGLAALFLVMGAFSILVPVVLWLWMAWKCKAGRPWARIVSTILFALSSLMMMTVGATGSWGLLGMVVSWFIGLAVVVLLWQRSSSRFFRAVPRY